MTIEQIKKDLIEIRYYYSKQRDFDSAAKTVGQCSIIEKVERYNNAVRKAPAQLYDIYAALYVYNNTQLAVSLDWDCSLDCIKRANSKLCNFLLEALNSAE